MGEWGQVGPLVNLERLLIRAESRQAAAQLSSNVEKPQHLEQLEIAMIYAN